MKRALLWDSGLYPYVAQKIAEGYDHVDYFTPYAADAFPVARKALWGSGLPGVTRVGDFFDEVDKAEIVVFPDLGAGDLQAYLKRQGKAVWGSGIGEVLELDRVRFRRLQRALGMPTPKTWVLVGTDALEAHLRDPENEHQFVKIGEFRGDMESHHHESWWLSEPWFNDLVHKLGPMGKSLEFMVEAAIDDAVEVGFDGCFVRDRYLTPCCYGYEVKDVAYVGRVVDYADLPEVILKANAALAPVLAEMDVRSWVSNEVRVVEGGIGYLIDPTLRMPSPPGGAVLEAFSNWPEVVTAGAHGKALSPKPEAKYLAEVILRSDVAEDGFLAIDIPEKVRPYVKLHGHCRVDDVDYVVALGMDVIGGAVGLGDSVDEACENATEVAKALKGYGLTFDESGFDVARERIKKGAEYGVDWE